MQQQAKYILWFFSGWSKKKSAECKSIDLHRSLDWHGFNNFLLLPIIAFQTKKTSHTHATGIKTSITNALLINRFRFFFTLTIVWFRIEKFRKSILCESFRYKIHIHIFYSYCTILNGTFKISCRYFNNSSKKISSHLKNQSISTLLQINSWFSL